MPESRLHAAQAAVLPCLITLLPLTVRESLGTSTLLGQVTTLAASLGRGCDVTLCALAHALPAVAGALQVTLLRLGEERRSGLCLLER